MIKDRAAAGFVTKAGMPATAFKVISGK